MQYFQAVRIGKERASKSQMILFKFGGFAMLTLTTKKKDGQFVLIGEEELVAVGVHADAHERALGGLRAERRDGGGESGDEGRGDDERAQREGSGSQAGHGEGLG